MSNKPTRQRPLERIVMGLRALAKFEHDDFSIAEEAAAEIEALSQLVRDISAAAESAWKAGTLPASVFPAELAQRMKSINQPTRGRNHGT